MESGQQSRVHYVRFVIDSTAEWFWYSAAWLLLPRKMVTCFVSFRRLAMFQSDFFILFTTQNIYFFPSLLFFECTFRVLLRLVLRWREHDFMTNHKEQVESMQKEMSKYFLISCFRLSQKNYFSRNFVRSENDTVAVAPNECGWTTKTHSKLCNNFNTNTHTHTLWLFHQPKNRIQREIQNRERLSDSRWRDCTPPTDRFSEHEREIPRQRENNQQAMEKLEQTQRTKIKKTDSVAVVVVAHVRHKKLNQRVCRTNASI